MNNPDPDTGQGDSQMPKIDQVRAPSVPNTAKEVSMNEKTYTLQIGSEREDNLTEVEVRSKVTAFLLNRIGELPVHFQTSIRQAFRRGGNSFTSWNGVEKIRIHFIETELLTSCWPESAPGVKARHSANV